MKSCCPPEEIEWRCSSRSVASPRPTDFPFDREHARTGYRRPIPALTFHPRQCESGLTRRQRAIGGNTAEGKGEAKRQRKLGNKLDKGNLQRCAAALALNYFHLCEYEYFHGPRTRVIQSLN